MYKWLKIKALLFPRYGVNNYCVLCKVNWGQNRGQKHATKTFVGFHNHSSLFIRPAKRYLRYQNRINTALFFPVVNTRIQHKECCSFLYTISVSLNFGLLSFLVQCVRYLQPLSFADVQRLYRSVSTCSCYVVIVIIGVQKSGFCRFLRRRSVKLT